MRASSRYRFSKAMVAALHEGKIVRIKAGTRHRFIGIWGVVVAGRLFVRSWSVKARSWYRTFLRDARGVIEVSRSEEHTSELQSPCKLVCRLLLEKKKKNTTPHRSTDS